MQNIHNRFVQGCKRGSARCLNFTCVILDLAANQTAVIKIKARLWNSTLVEDYAYGVNQVHIISNAEIRLDPLLNIKQYRVDDDYSTVCNLSN